MPVVRIVPKRFEDPRGWFSETWQRDRFEAAGIRGEWVQDNQSYSRPAGTLRGIHFQTPPHAQAKLVRCLRGRVWDVAVDLRAGSPTYGQWVAAELSAARGEQLYIPAGFGHGFLTLEPETEIAYKVDAFYAPDCDAGIAWNDPDLGISWPLPGAAPELSDKDARLPSFKEFVSPFGYDGRPLELVDA
ncbi:dTDP-4-dehydro-6-deoxy-D-glucose 3,5-epimerase [Sphingomonas changbaiensis NBRC 104936]|uniref:dTDP-4-dehydrorhamnose 3,5-epimerase n=1 Tax=Sphingomonas changbaiensis NBRC 104936 TaxID=1219043 RepID=A0A0E9MSA8_9SPHN|nr:dTDP-4-dehydrorhamnose 3,5-epimerase [Sphingomonas changbaiensis]GAO40316.1 dTDP-4-dehydro-6-deoxy-D-glucose 3,5-epimerase [Sphingomonas changbaiensis NBRC 104936]